MPNKKEKPKKAEKIFDPAVTIPKKEPFTSFLGDMQSAETDPQGTWTGVPKNPTEKPVQDADDL